MYPRLLHSFPSIFFFLRNETLITLSQYLISAMTFASMQISVQVALSHPLNNLQRVFMTNLEILETTGLFGIKYKIPFVFTLYSQRLHRSKRSSC